MKCMCFVDEYTHIKVLDKKKKKATISIDLYTCVWYFTHTFEYGISQS